MEENECNVKAAFFNNSVEYVKNIVTKFVEQKQKF